jgi:signal transduction histidine kinase/ActR/RegA family two-component response regulator
MDRREDIEQPTGAHLCQIFGGEAQQEAVLGSFFAGGLAGGERCLLFGHASARRRALRALRREGVAVQAEVDRGALVPSAPTLSRALAADDRATFMACLLEQERQALDAGFRGLRVSWAVRHAGVRLDHLVALEAGLSEVLKGSGIRLLCQYPRDADPFVLHEALRTHRRVVVDGEVCPNPFFEPPEIVLGAGGAQAELEWKLGELRRAKSGQRQLGEITRSLDEQRCELERAGRAREELLAKLAHELRNPLGTVSNALQVLRLGAEGDEARRRALAAAERQVVQQSRLVEQMLEASQLVRGELELRREPLDLAQVVADTVVSHRRTLRSSDPAIELVLPSAPLPVVGDRLRLAQALTQLLLNAVKFSAGRPASRGVTVRAAARDDGRAEITVADHGPGIRPDLLPHIFEIFTQEAQSLERQSGGLGMGLAIVKGLVELHGGEVQAGNRPGEGAELKVLLPLSPAPANANVPICAEQGALRVLVVEDNVDAGTTLCDFLELAGFEVALAASGREGVEAARRFLPAVVLCDLGLPEMNGFEVAVALRHDPATAGARLIAVTGYGRDEDRRRSREAGFDLHLTKPVDPIALRRLLRESTSRPPTPPAAERAASVG